MPQWPLEMLTGRYHNVRVSSAFINGHTVEVTEGRHGQGKP